MRHPWASQRTGDQPPGPLQGWSPLTTTELDHGWLCSLLGSPVRRGGQEKKERKLSLNITEWDWQSASKQSALGAQEDATRTRVPSRCVYYHDEDPVLRSGNDQLLQTGASPRCNICKSWPGSWGRLRIGVIVMGPGQPYIGQSRTARFTCLQSQDVANGVRGCRRRQLDAVLAIAFV